MEQDAAWKRLKVSVLVKREKGDWGPFVSRSPTISLGSLFSYCWDSLGRLLWRLHVHPLTMPGNGLDTLPRIINIEPNRHRYLQLNTMVNVSIASVLPCREVEQLLRYLNNLTHTLPDYSCNLSSWSGWLIGDDKGRYPGWAVDYSKPHPHPSTSSVGCISWKNIIKMNSDKYRRQFSDLILNWQETI